MIEKFNKTALLLDFYGSLLTDKQKEIMSFHFEEDMSLGEIAEQLNITRQAVHDLIKRSEKILYEYEDKLNLLDKFLEQQRALVKIKTLLEKDPVDVKSAIQLLETLTNM